MNMEIVNFEMPEFGNPRISGAGATRSPLSVFAGQTPAAIFPKMGAWLGTKKADQGSAIVSAAAPRKLQGVRGLRWPREYALKGMRGASWNNDATNLRVSDRNNAGWTNTNRNNNVGFRPASTPAVSVAAERSFAKRMGQSWRFAATKGKASFAATTGKASFAATKAHSNAAATKANEKIQSWLAHSSWANTYNLRKQIFGEPQWDEPRWGEAPMGQAAYG